MLSKRWKRSPVRIFAFFCVLSFMVHLMTKSTTDAIPQCMKKLYLGDTYGGWTICDTGMPGIRGGMVYTIGVGSNIEWDKEMMKTYRTKHHGWDPTPRAKQFVKNNSLPALFTFHPFGLGVVDGSVTLKLPVGHTDSYTPLSYKKATQQGKLVDVPILTLESMMRIMGHKRLDILKIDIEGAEFELIERWSRDRYVVRADQVLIEFHERFFPQKKQLVKKAIGQMQGLGFNVFNRTKLEASFIRVK